MTTLPVIAPVGSSVDDTAAMSCASWARCVAVELATGTWFADVALPTLVAVLAAVGAVIAVRLQLKQADRLAVVAHAIAPVRRVGRDLDELIDFLATADDGNGPVNQVTRWSELPQLSSLQEAYDASVRLPDIQHALHEVDLVLMGFDLAVERARDLMRRRVRDEERAYDFANEIFLNTAQPEVDFLLHTSRLLRGWDGVKVDAGKRPKEPLLGRVEAAAVALLGA